MNYTEIKQLFSFIESQSIKDNVITKQDIYKAVGVDLDKDQQITNLPLYRKKTVVNSKYTKNKVTCYEYTTEENVNGYEKYMMYMCVKPDCKCENDNDCVKNEVHATEKIITEKTNDKWIKSFSDEFEDDDEITFDEFKTHIFLMPYVS